RGAHALAAAAPRVPLLILGAATIAAAIAIERTRRAGEWTRLVTIVALAMAAWTATFDAIIHPAIARTRSPREFMATVDRLAPADASLYASFPVDPGVRFYAPRSLVRLELESPAPRWMLLWEDEWRRVRDASGEALPVLAVGDARQVGHGALALVMAPAGRLR